MARLLEQIRSRATELAPFSISEAIGFGDVLWSPALSNEELYADPGVRLQSVKRWVVLQQVRDEIRYYAGPLPSALLGAGEVPEVSPDELGILDSIDDAIAFANAFLSGEAIESIAISRRRPRPA